MALARFFHKPRAVSENTYAAPAASGSALSARLFVALTQRMENDNGSN